MLAADARVEPVLLESIMAGGRLAELHLDGRVNVAVLRAASANWRLTGTQTAGVSIDQHVAG